MLVGAGSVSEPGATLFGDARRRRRAPRAPPAGPTLRIDFASSGGELIVRDYPDDVFPSEESYWPESRWPYAEPEPSRRPRTKGLSAAKARRRLARWRAQRERQAEFRRLVPARARRGAKR